MKYFVIDAFTDEQFKGNPAGVCILDNEIESSLMKAIAKENNLPETAFLLQKDNQNTLRWFTPEVEIDLCGHATLATAFVVMNYMSPELTTIDFKTMSGTVSVSRKNDMYILNFPSRPPKPIDIDSRIEKALGCTVLESYKARDLLLIVKDEETVKNLKPNFKLLQEIDSSVYFTIIVSAQGSSCDFVSRFFNPNDTPFEDPVTGSAHSTLIPFWSKRLGKKQMVAKQLSERGGTLVCEQKDERVLIGGKAVCYLKGEL